MALDLAAQLAAAAARSRGVCKHCYPYIRVDNPDCETWQDFVAHSEAGAFLAFQEQGGDPDHPEAFDFEEPTYMRRCVQLLRAVFKEYGAYTRRAAKRVTLSDQALDASHAVPPDDGSAYQREVLMATLYDHAMNLPADDRELVLGFYFEGRSQLDLINDAIASGKYTSDQRSKAKSYVGVKLHRAKAKLRAALEAEC